MFQALDVQAVCCKGREALEGSLGGRLVDPKASESTILGWEGSQAACLQIAQCTKRLVHLCVVPCFLSQLAEGHDEDELISHNLILKTQRCCQGPQGGWFLSAKSPAQLCGGFYASAAASAPPSKPANKLRRVLPI